MKHLPKVFMTIWIIILGCAFFSQYDAVTRLFIHNTAIIVVCILILFVCYFTFRHERLKPNNKYRFPITTTLLISFFLLIIQYYLYEFIAVSNASPKLI